MSIDPQVKKRIDNFVKTSKDMNLVTKLSKRPGALRLFAKIYNKLSPETKSYVYSCTRNGDKIDFGQFSEASMVSSLPLLEKILRKVNK